MFPLLNSIRLRLTLWMTLGAAGALAVLLATAFVQVRDYSLRDADRQLLADREAVAAGLSSLFTSVETSGQALIAELLRLQPNRAQLLEMLKVRVLHDPDIAGVLVALEPGNPVAGDERIGLHVSYSARGITVTDFVANRYAFWDMPWYLKTLSGVAWWSEPYFNDACGGQDVVTFDMPLRDDDGRMLGMVSVDLAIDRIEAVAAELGLSRDGGNRRDLLAAQNGRLLIHWDRAYERGYTLHQLSERREFPSAGWLASTLGESQALQATIRTDDADRERAVSLPVGTTGWRIGSVVRESDLLAPLYDATWRITLVAAAVLLLLTIALRALARRLTQPVEALAHAADRIADGDYEHPLPERRGGDELARLIRAFARARSTVRESLARAEAAIGERRRLQGELDVARQLQLAMLPDDRLFFGSRLEVEFAARLRAANAVGGDFYGFLAPAPGICIFYVGDVSGRGVPAALLMARLSALLPALARQGGTPADVLDRVVEQFDTDAEHAVAGSLLVGRLELAGGGLQLASAGHPAPLLLRHDGSQQWAALTAGPALGADTAARWPVWSTTLAPGDRLLACSNGITDSTDSTGAAYGDERLQIACERYADRPLRALPDLLLDDVQQHAAGREPDDDLTVVLLGVRHRD